MKSIPSDEADREHRDVWHRRLLFRSWRRGTQESDLVLGSFAEHSLEALDNDQLGRFEALLDCADPDLFDWIFGVSAPPPEHDHHVMRLLRGFCTEQHLGPQRRGQFESDAAARATS